MARIVGQTHAQGLRLVVETLVSAHRALVLAVFGLGLARLARIPALAYALKRAQHVQTLAIVSARIHGLTLVYLALTVATAVACGALAHIVELVQVTLTLATVQTDVLVATQLLQVVARTHLSLTSLALEARIAAAHRLILELVAFAVGAAYFLVAVGHVTLVVELHVVEAHRGRTV